MNSFDDEDCAGLDLAGDPVTRNRLVADPYVLLFVPFQYAGGAGGSGGGFGNSAGAGGQIGDSLTISALNGTAGGDGAGGGGGTSAYYPYANSLLILGGNAGNAGFGGGGGGSGAELCVTPNLGGSCSGIPNNTTGGNAGFGGGGGGGDIGGMGGLFGGAGGTDDGRGYGGSAGGGAAGLGGAIFQRTGTLTIDGCSFAGNTAASGVGFREPEAKGGAVFHLAGTIHWRAASTFSGNAASDAGRSGIDNPDVYGTSANGAPGIISISHSHLQTSDFVTIVNRAAAGSTITFDSSLTNAVIPVAAEISTHVGLTFDGTIGGAHNVTLRAVNNRLFCVYPGGVVFRNLRMMNGNGTGSGCGTGKERVPSMLWMGR